MTLAALQRGDKVIATARPRSLAKLADLQAAGADVLELDVTSTLETLHAIAQRAVAIHGRVDVVVNNAGFIGAGSMEENTLVLLALRARARARARARIHADVLLN